MRIDAKLVHAGRSPRRLFSLMRRVINLALQGELLAIWRRAHPASISGRTYRRWCRRRSCLEAGSLHLDGKRPLRIVALLDCGEAETNRRIAASLDLQTLRCVDILERSHGSGVRRLNALSPGISEPIPQEKKLSAFLETPEEKFTWLLWITESVALAKNFNAALGAAVESFPGAAVYYTDEDEVLDDGTRAHPIFKPAWDREQILEANYVGCVVAMQADVALALGAEASIGSEGLRRALVKAVWQIDENRVVHMPDILVHVRRENGRYDDVRIDSELAAAVEDAVRHRGAAVEISDSGEPRLSYVAMPESDGVSVVIPTRDRGDLLMRCVDSLLAHTGPPRVEIVIVDNDSVEPETRRCFRAIEARVCTRVRVVAGEFNFPRLCNAGVDDAREPIVTLLNNDTYIDDPGWLRELSSLARRPYTGAVGPMLFCEDGKVQSAGVLLGVNRIATDYLAGLRMDHPIVRAWCRTRRSVSAVGGACLTVERQKYLAVGGMDERYAVSLNETDLCLRLEEAGLTNVFTPFASVFHIQGATRGYDMESTERRRLAAEEKLFRSRWGSLLAQTDPAHNVNLRRWGSGLELDFDSKSVEPRAGWRRAIGVASLPQAATSMASTGG